jgi:predicted dehydrogenase
MATKNALIFGCGSHMLEHLLPVLTCHEHISPKWCIDLDPSRAKKCHEVFGIEAVSSISDCSEVGLVISAVRPSASLAALEAGAQLGCPVFLEKPAGLSTQHLGDLEMFARQNSIKVWFGYNYQHSDMARAVSAEICKSAPISCEYTFLSRRPLETENGEDSLFECWLRGNSVHLMALISYFHGEHIILVSKSAHFEGDTFILVADYVDKNSCLIRIRIGNRTSKFVFRCQLNTIDGSVIEANGFDSVVVKRGSTSEAVYQSSTFNKIRSKDGFYQQFSEMTRVDDGDEIRFAAAKRAMLMAEVLLAETQTTASCAQPIDLSTLAT